MTYAKALELKGPLEFLYAAEVSWILSQQILSLKVWWEKAVAPVRDMMLDCYNTHQSAGVEVQQIEWRKTLEQELPQDVAVHPYIEENLLRTDLLKFRPEYYDALRAAGVLK